MTLFSGGAQQGIYFLSRVSCCALLLVCIRCIIIFLLKYSNNCVNCVIIHKVKRMVSEFVNRVIEYSAKADHYVSLMEYFRNSVS